MLIGAQGGIEVTCPGVPWTTLELRCEDDFDGTDTVDRIAIAFPGFRETGSHPAAGQNNVSFVQCLPEFAKIVSQPAQRFKRMAEHVPPAPFIDDFTVALQDAGCICQIWPGRSELAKYVA